MCEDDLGLRSLPEERARQVCFAGDAFVRELLVFGQAADEAEDEGFVASVGFPQVDCWHYSVLFTAESAPPR
jgi:hypothetical protein